MDKKTKLPPTIASQIRAHASAAGDDLRPNFTDDSGRNAALSFETNHKALLNLLTKEIGTAIAQRDGDALLLWDACLLGLAQHVRDAMQRHGIVVQPDAKGTH